jgi:hypothetical protein
MATTAPDRESVSGPSAGVYILVAVLVVASAMRFSAPYLSRVPGFQGSGWQVQFHFLTLAAWLGMLGAQARFARSGRYEVQRRVGQLSYVLVQLIGAPQLMERLWQSVWGVTGRQAHDHVQQRDW